MVPAGAPSTVTAFLGAPDTRPKEDYCVVNNSFHLDRDDWEAAALVAWVLDGGADASNKSVTDAFHRCFGLQRSEVAVTHHHPEDSPGQIRSQDTPRQSL